TPKTIVKKIADIMEGARGDSDSRSSRRRVAEQREDAYHDLSASQLARRISEMETRMFQHARDLEFEEAAALRDEIEALRERTLKA
ncbi:MAG: UvrB/UvrC motif-containing protein, partial [Xanthomonadales bacterium]|nr:UvrB/UvrC motif-containing protein [Xanthomonadales bacterium]